MELTSEFINEVFQHFASQQATCITCGQPFNQIGAFVPNDQAEVEAPADKLRAFFFPICGSCQADPETFTVIEAFAFKNLHTQH